MVNELKKKNMNRQLFKGNNLAQNLIKENLLFEKYNNECISEIQSLKKKG